MNFYWILINTILASTVFVADAIFSLGALSLFYVLILLSTFWIGKKKEYIISAIISALILTILGWVIQYRYTPITIDLTFFYAEINYEALFRAVSMLVTTFVGIVLLKERIKEDELQKLNETLELRIFAKTSLAEKRAECLQKQIDALQCLKQKQVNESIDKLDDVITALKKMAQEDKDD